MLGKLYITLHSTSEKLYSVQELANEAAQLKIAGDAISRNALTKLLNAVGKAIGDMAKDGKKDKEKSGSKSIAPVDDAEVKLDTAPEGDKLSSEEGRVEGECQDEDNDTNMAGIEDLEDDDQ